MIINRIYGTPPFMIINRIYETQNLLSLLLVSFLVGLRTYQYPFLRRGSKIICPMSQFWGMSKIPASAVNYELLAKFSSVSFPRKYRSFAPVGAECLWI
jgi:hypothetical protein